MKEYEAHHEDKRKKKEAPKKKKNKKRSANPEAYANHLRLELGSRLGPSRERMVQAGAAWRQRHEKLRAAEGCGVATEA